MSVTEWVCEAGLIFPGRNPPFIEVCTKFVVRHSTAGADRVAAAKRESLKRW